jgi:hypothetical protein
LNDVSHSLKPSALSPQSTARADTTPAAAAATIKKTTLFQALSRIRRRSKNIAIDLETAKRETGLKVGGIGPFKDYSVRRALGQPSADHHTILVMYRYIFATVA